MRAITERAIRAFMNSTPFRRDNTAVECMPSQISLKLHGHTIAYRDADGTFISSCGWETNTTKERLNGLLDNMNIGRIYQKDFIWYWKDGEEFPSGYVKIA